MKKTLVISFLFLGITLAHSLKIAVTIGYYAFFTEDFVERFCENKERPELYCDGKCQLSKMLLQETNDDIPSLNLDFLKNETVLFLEANMNIVLLENPDIIFDIPGYTNLYDYNSVYQELRPPRA